MNLQESSGLPGRSSSRLRHAGGALFLLLTIAFGSWFRIHTALADPDLLQERSAGLLRTDPALLFYFLERIIEGHGLPPADFRADPRVQYPALTDNFALDSVGQEFPLAWARLLLGDETPLHVFCIKFMGIIASLTVVGVYLAALELTGKVRWGCAAALLFVVTGGNYRTIGFVLMREDFSLPFLSLHFGLLARAARLRTAASLVLCALALSLAVATWQLTAFVILLEAGCLALWYLRTGVNPMAAPYAWIVPALVGLASLGVPVLSRSGFILSPAMLLALGLLAAALVARKAGGRAAQWAAAAATIALLLPLQPLVAKSGGGDYHHVWTTMLAKLRYLGQLPDDPRRLPFEARLLWQGPFRGLEVSGWFRVLGLALILALPLLFRAVRGWIRGNGEAAVSLLGIFSLFCLANTWLVARVMPLPALLLPVAAVVVLDQLRGRRAAAMLAGVVLVGQGAYFAYSMGHYRSNWYAARFRTYEYQALLEALPSLVPEGEAVMSDSTNSPTILAYTRRPIVVQPKWEEVEPRRRLEEFLTVFFHGTPRELHRLVRGKYRCRYLLVDRWTLGRDMRYMAGVLPTATAPEPDTPADLFGTTDGRVLTSVPGFRLLYRSPAWIVTDPGNSSDILRLYELVDF